MGSKTCLIAVDVQNDFLPGGSIEVPEGDQVIAPLVKLAEGSDLIIAVGDLHPDDHCSFIRQGGVFAPHCIKGTKGARIHPKIRKVSDSILWKGIESNQDQFSAFAATTLRPKTTLVKILKENGFQKGDSVLIGGLGIENCVKWTALDASASGYRTSLILSASRAYAPVSESFALSELVHAGVLIHD